MYCGNFTIRRHTSTIPNSSSCHVAHVATVSNINAAEYLNKYQRGVFVNYFEKGNLPSPSRSSISVLAYRAGPSIFLFLLSNYHTLSPKSLD